MAFSDKELYKQIPKVDNLLNDNKIKNLIEIYGRQIVVDVVRDQLIILRNLIKEKNVDKFNVYLKTFNDDVSDILQKKTNLNVKKVINATGVILHTNLGRAPLNKNHLDKVFNIMCGYSNLEYDIDTGKRGLRYAHVEEKLRYITGAEDALVVNNNAAAVMLVLNTFANNKESVTSRGELVEIGGSFRVPEVMRVSGTKLVEVGTTNKTHIEDYENAITENTALFLKVHTSNYKIVGFSESVKLEDLCKLGNKHNIAVYQDLGSGVLIDFSKYGLDYEPTVLDSVKAGVDIVSFSGDKLLGGPQAGIIVGKKKFIDKIKKNQMTRALRVDKFTISMLDAVLCEYLNEENVIKNIPILSKLTKPLEIIKKEADQLLNILKTNVKNCDFVIEKSYAQAGGGSMPLLEIPSFAVSIVSHDLSINKLELSLRQLDIPIIGRIFKDKLLLDLRSLDKEEFDIICENLKKVCNK